MKKMFVVALVCFVAPITAQTLPLDELPKPARQLLKDYVLIPGGKFTANIRDGFDSLQFGQPKQIAVTSVYMSRFEISVAEYRQFFQETGDLQNKYDTAVWTHDFTDSYNESIAKIYTNHPAYDNHPIVGITWEQAVRYCYWKAAQVNSLLKNTDYKVEIRLPTDAEWQFAALGVTQPVEDELISERSLYPWGGEFFSSPIQGKMQEPELQQRPDKNTPGISLIRLYFRWGFVHHARQIFPTQRLWPLSDGRQCGRVDIR